MKAVVFLLETILKKLHIKTKPNILLTYLFYGITAFLVIISISRLLGFLIGDPRIPADISPYWFSVWFFMPILAYSYYVNSGIPKNDQNKINMYILTFISFTILLGTMVSTWINSAIWYGIEKLPNYANVYKTYPELFSPALKTLSFVIPFYAIFKIIDYFLLIFRDEDLPKAIAGYTGLSTRSNAKDTGVFTSSTVISKHK
jgi:hypothetical protein